MLKSIEGENYKDQREAVIAYLEKALEIARAGTYTQMTLVMSPPCDGSRNTDDIITYFLFDHVVNALDMIEMFKIEAVLTAERLV
jgi:hypothetical protein